MIKFITKQKEFLLKSVSVFSLATLGVFQAQAQCPSSGINLYTQADIDNFPIAYPGCTEINGHLEIQGNDITNLLGLSSITTINGNLSIYYSPNLKNLHGLENVTYISIVDIWNTEGLKSLDGLDNLDSVGNDLFINYNDSLEDISAIQNTNISSMIPDWWGGVTINDNPFLALCHYANICEYLEGSGIRNIYNNSGDCLDESTVNLACAEPLSVRLLSFDVMKHAQSVVINWTASQDKELEKYVVERSVNGQTWSKVSEVKTQNANINKYSSTDYSPAQGINMYRVKMVSADGNATYSEVKSVDFLSSSKVNVYPNPVKDILHISAEGEKVSVKNILGMEIFNGESIQSIDVSSWMPGMYYVQLSSGEVVKIIKE